MKLTIDASKLRDGRDALKRAAPRSLHNAVLLSASGDTLTMSAAGDGIYAEYTDTCSVSEDGIAIVGSDSLKTLDAFDGPIAITRGKTLKLTGSMDIKLNLKSVPTEIFEMPERSSDWHELDKDSKKIMYAEGDEQLIRDMVFVTPKYMACTNNHRFAFILHTLPITDNFAMRGDLFERSLQSDSPKIALGRHVWIRSGKLTTAFAKSQAPEIYDVLDYVIGFSDNVSREVASEIIVSKSELVSKLTALTVLAIGNYAILRFTIANGVLRLESPGSQLGSGIAEIDGESQAGEIDTAFSGRYMLDAIQKTDGDKIRLSCLSLSRHDVAQESSLLWTGENKLCHGIVPAVITQTRAEE